MIVEILIIGLVTYYVTLFVVVYKCNLKEMFNNEKPRIEQLPEPEPAPDDLISKSSFTWKEPKPPTAAPPPEEETEKSEEEEKTNAEYYEDETEEPETDETGDEEQEQFEDLRQKEIQAESSSDIQPGVTGANVDQVIGVIKNVNATEEEEHKAANNISAMQNDQILQTIISTTSGEDRVNYLLKKRLGEYMKNKAAAEADNENGDFHNFNIKNYA